MPPTLSQLEQEKRDLLRTFSQLGDLRPGSITGIVRRCGKPTCHCAQPDDPGHGPNLRLTYKAQGKTISEALPTPIAVRKAEREIAESSSSSVMLSCKSTSNCAERVRSKRP